MKIKKQQASYPLTEHNIDVIAEQVEQFLLPLHLQNANVMRVRLSIEEILLRWMEYYKEEMDVTVYLSLRFGRPQIMIQLAGERYNPLFHTESEEGKWMQSLFIGTESSPLYDYHQGINTVLFKLRKLQRNPAAVLLGALMVGTVLGLLGRAVLPPDVLNTILSLFLDPVKIAVFRTLNTVSGPVMFLSVLTAICGVGNLSVINASGKRLIVRFLTICVLTATVGAAVSMLVYHLSPQISAPDSTYVSGGLLFLLQFIPNDLLSPFINGESPQIVLAALLLGNAILVIGTRSEPLAALIRTANDTALVIADWIGRLAPYFICVLLILGIWNGSIYDLIGMWKPILIFLPIAFLAMFGSMLRVSIGKKVSMRILFRKMLPSFCKAIRTSSVDAAYEENLHCCTKELGIHKSLTEYGIPLGLVTYMPAGALAALLVTMYAANVYGVEITPLRLITAILLTTALIMASPPVTGVGLLAYAAIFLHLGIPNEALTMAMTADILFGLLTGAFNQAMLQTELVLEADRMHLLRFDKLQNEPHHASKKG